MVKRVVTSLFVVVILPFFLIACSSQDAESAKTGVSEGEEALDFTLPDLSGNKISLSDLKGKKTVLLDFTTTWCPHCITIIPTLNEMQAKYKDKNFEVIAIYVNERENSVKKLANKHGMKYTVLLDEDGAIGTKYAVRGVPTLLLVDKDGIIRYRGHNIPESDIDKLAK